MAVVGAGKMARNHLKAIAGIAGARVAAAVDPDPGARLALEAEQPGLHVYPSLRELLSAEPVDVVHVCSPPATHASIALEALDAGCHVYVEKPFAESAQQARVILDRAQRLRRLVCAGHQLLAEYPAREAATLLDALGRIVHIESCFAFRPVRRAPGGRAPLRADLQLLDILPHPTYLLLAMLERVEHGTTTLDALTVSETGTVHALVRRGRLTANLFVTLEGRPVESYLRVTGTNGTVIADFVRGTVVRQIGPGTSGIDKALAPYQVARQLLSGTTSALASRIRKRQTSYAGLGAMIGQFYTAIRDGGESPVSPQSIVDTTAICEAVAARLASQAAATPAASAPWEPARPAVAVTGGTGFLGRAVVEALVSAGESVRVIARREPASWERVAGAEYRVANLAEELAPSLLDGVRAVIHAAAETAGGWTDHQRNSIDATGNVLRAAARAGVRECFHVSSVAVLDGRRVIDEASPLIADSRSRGPYVWGKLESERLAIALGAELGVRVHVVRPGAIVDDEAFDPPGRLGKRIGNVFVAVGSRSQRLGVVDVRQAARLLAWMAGHPEEAPERLNLVTPGMTSKRALVSRLRRTNPDLTVVWFPTVLVHLASWVAIALQKARHPRKPAISVARVFAVQEFDTTRMSALALRAEQEPAPVSAAL